MPLTALAVKSAKPRARPYKMCDLLGLYLLVTPKGQKYWRLNYLWMTLQKTANTRVELTNGTTFKTNEAGYVEEITYQPLNSPGVRDSRQTAVGREGIAGDVGGHIQACRHGGTCDRFNLFPQDSNFNNSAY